MMLASSGREGRALRGPLDRGHLHARDHDPCVEVAADELEHPPVIDPSGHAGHQGVVLDAVEEPVQIDIDDEGLARLDRPPGGVRRPDGRSGPAGSRSCRSEKPGSKMGLEDLAQRLLEEAVEHRRHAQLPRPATGLGDGHPADGAGSVRARVEASADLRPDGPQMGPQGSAVVMPSGPGAPPLRSTRLSARARLSRERKTSHGSPARAG